MPLFRESGKPTRLYYSLSVSPLQEYGIYVMMKKKRGEMAMVCGRFAPSPSGRIHLGNLWASLLAWLSVRSQGGAMVLRLEDLDPERCNQRYCDQIMRDLEWLGLDWDEEPVYQSKRTPLYAEIFDQLQAQGVLYPCYCTRAERLAASAPHRSDGVVLYDGHCRTLTPEQKLLFSQTRKAAWRIEVPSETISFVDLLQGTYTENLAQSCGDFIIRRSDGVYAYQLAVVIDDGDMGVTEVVRGSDLLDSTPRQIYLQQLLSLPHPTYGHVPLLLAPDGRRLAKRDRDKAMDELQEQYSARELVGQLAYAAGLLDEYFPISPQELIPLFSWEKLPKKDFVITLQKEPDFC